MVALVSNIPHYYYAARALSEEGALAVYVTSWCLLDGEEPPAWLPALYRRKLEGRRHPGLTRGRVARILAPEAIQKAFPKLHLCSSARATRINNHLFDLRARARLRVAPPWNVLHYVNTIGLECARAAKDRGALVVYDSRQEHPAMQNLLVANEASRWGIRPPALNQALGERMLRELTLADHVIVPSQFAKGSFVSYGGAENRIHVLPYGVDTELFSQVPDVAPGGVLKLLFVGTLGLRKGILNLLEALRLVKSTHVQLTCIGSVDPEISTALRKYSGLYTHHPVVPKVDLPNYFSSHDLFVLPSIADAYPLAVLEALSAGLPVLTTHNVGSSDLITHGVHGLIVPPGNSAALASAIEGLSADHRILASMRNDVRALRPMLSWARYEQTLRTLYREHLVAPDRESVGDGKQPYDVRDTNRN
jgi:glycosyltransferase involved in cell wall biosynthesis